MRPPSGSTTDWFRVALEGDAVKRAHRGKRLRSTDPRVVERLPPRHSSRRPASLNGVVRPRDWALGSGRERVALTRGGTIMAEPGENEGRVLRDTVERLQAEVTELRDRQEILACLHRYAKGLDRRDWDLFASAYHADAIDQHGDFVGGPDGLVEYVSGLMADWDYSVHLLDLNNLEIEGDVAHSEVLRPLHATACGWNRPGFRWRAVCRPARATEWSVGDRRETGRRRLVGASRVGDICRRSECSDRDVRPQRSVVSAAAHDRDPLKAGSPREIVATDGLT